MQVLSEVKDPRKKLKRALPASVLLVSVLYILVNVVYVYFPTQILCISDRFSHGKCRCSLYLKRFKSRRIQLKLFSGGLSVVFRATTT